MWATTAESSTNIMSLVRTSRACVLALRRARLKSLPSDSFCCCVECKFLQQAKENAKYRWSKDASLFDAAADFEWLRGAAIELHYSLRVSVERLDHDLTFGWATNVWENLKETVSAD